MAAPDLVQPGEGVRFFQRQGIPPASAVSIELIEKVAGE